MAGLVSYVRQHNIDIVHAANNPRDAFYGTLLTKLTGVKSIFHLHAQWGSYMSFPVRWAMQQADGIIGVSKFVEQSLIARSFLPSKIQVVHNSLDINNWHYDTDGKEIRQEFNIPLNAPLLASISLLVPWKGHELLLKALVRVRE